MVIGNVQLLPRDKGRQTSLMISFIKLPDPLLLLQGYLCHVHLKHLIVIIDENTTVFNYIFALYLIHWLFYMVQYQHLLLLHNPFMFYQLDFHHSFEYFHYMRNSSSPVYLLANCLLMFLLLFPVFTLSTNFPIIAITLRNNLKGLFLRETRRYSFFTSRCLFPLLAIIPPTIIAIITSNVEFLVGITGAYAG
ncbi:unnamed protein product, partial [Meganyctiphanes norvegica]